MHGYFTPGEFWGYVEELQREYPRYISPKFSIGNTYEKRSIHAFYMGNDMQEPQEYSKRSIILFTGVHHAREPLAVSMIVNMVGQLLYKLVHKDKKSNDLFSDVIILFVPIVNLDTYSLISEKFYANEWQTYKELRKSRRKISECRPLDYGVDLNRNYDSKFAHDDIGSSNNQCEEDYRGAHAFSEPETQAIKSIIEITDGRVISAMNFHCYGNLWIHPFNYENHKENWTLQSQHPFYEIYSHLRQNQPFPTNAKVGNAKSSIDYIANGEASDWMLGEKGILAFSPELGNKDPKSEDFYIDSSLHEQVVRDDYKTIETFIMMHRLGLTFQDVRQEPDYGIDYTFDLLRKLRILAPDHDYSKGTNSNLLQSAANTYENPNQAYYENEDEEIVMYWTFFNSGLNNHNDLTLDFELNKQFHSAFEEISYATDLITQT